MKWPQRSSFTHNINCIPSHWYWDWEHSYSLAGWLTVPWRKPQEDLYLSMLTHWLRRKNFFLIDYMVWLYMYVYIEIPSSVLVLEMRKLQMRQEKLKLHILCMLISFRLIRKLFIRVKANLLELFGMQKNKENEKFSFLLVVFKLKVIINVPLTTILSSIPLLLWTILSPHCQHSIKYSTSLLPPV